MNAIASSMTVIVQARFSSQRLPGKVLRQVAGKPMIQFLTERLERCRLADRVIVATSDQASDDAVAAWCHQTGTECFRGPL
ncbi:MAG TPA: hypothetical protein VKT80_10665, partial [Chloroflexota bacterium]|nr:hypothetical protein [Chloroflexota bacterium]